MQDMLYANGERRAPSLVVESGTTVTIGGDHGIEGLDVRAHRPRTLRALKTVAGLAGRSPDRLSDAKAFERVVDTGGLTELREDREGRIAGHSPVLVRRMLESLDPDEPIPDRVRIPFTRRDRMEGDTVYVPIAQAISQLSFFSLFTHFGDIVIETGGTLVLEDDLTYVLADSFLAYQNTRVIQRGSWVAIDVGGSMQGSAWQVAHSLSKGRLAIDWAILQK